MKAYKRKSRGRRIALTVVIFLLICSVFAGIYAAYYFGLIPKKTYTAEKFGIETVKSSIDFDKDGIDDYTDILLGARQDAKNKPKYDGQYWEGGYPPENIGVCTDVVWRAFKNAGYCLKDMVDKDISLNKDKYPTDAPDPNIDFRRVRMLKVFFQKYAKELTCDTSKLDQWQPGDIVIFEDRHIGIVSDKRNAKGIPYLIHNANQFRREEDAMHKMEITAHFRFDASKVDKDMLIRFE